MKAAQPSSLLRYAAVGAFATAAHYGLLVLLVEQARVVPWLAAGLGAVLGAQVAFAGNRRYTFDAAAPAPRAWWRFQATAALGALMNMAIVAALVHLGAHYLAAQVVATVVVVLATYEVNRRWSFASTP